jgi:hypothetical protein
MQELGESIIDCVHGKHDRYEWIVPSPLQAYISPRDALYALAGMAWCVPKVWG